MIDRSKAAADILHDAALLRAELGRVEIAHGAYVLPRDTSHMLAWLDYIERRAKDILTAPSSHPLTQE